MTKLRTPLLSFAASNSLKNLFSFLKRRGQHLVESKPIPPDAKSLAQLSWRHMYLKAVALWHALSPAEQQDWESQARRRHMTGFAWFMSQALKPNPGLYLPLQGGTMAGGIVMDTNKISDLPDPIANQDADTLAARIAAIIAHSANVNAHHNEIHDYSKHTDQTRTIFYPVSPYTDGFFGSRGVVNPGVRLDPGPVTSAWFEFLVPSDFVSFDSLKVVWLAYSGTDGQNWVCDPLSYYCADTESIFTHLDAPANLVINVPDQDVKYVTDVGFTLVNLSPGDFAGIEIERVGTADPDTFSGQILVLGLQLTYTAQQ